MQPVNPVRTVLASLATALLLLGLAPLSRAEAPLSAEQVVARVEETFRGLTDYECLIDTESRLGSKVETALLRFRFKKPQLLRAHVLKGHGKGSEVVLAADGKIHACEGGLLRPIVVSFSPNDTRVKSIRGVPLSELVWSSFYRKLREQMVKPGTHTALMPHSDPEQPYELVLTYTEGPHHVRETYLFDPHLWVMVQGDLFEDQVRVDHAVFRDIRLNPGFKDSLFRL